MTQSDLGDALGVSRQTATENPHAVVAPRHLLRRTKSGCHRRNSNGSVADLAFEQIILDPLLGVGRADDHPRGQIGVVF